MTTTSALVAMSNARAILIADTTLTVSSLTHSEALLFDTTSAMRVLPAITTPLPSTTFQTYASTSIYETLEPTPTEDAPAPSASPKASYQQYSGVYISVLILSIFLAIALLVLGYLVWRCHRRRKGDIAGLATETKPIAIGNPSGAETNTSERTLVEANGLHRACRNGSHGVSMEAIPRSRPIPGQSCSTGAPPVERSAISPISFEEHQSRGSVISKAHIKDELASPQATNKAETANQRSLPPLPTPFVEETELSASDFVDQKTQLCLADCARPLESRTTSTTQCDISSVSPSESAITPRL